VSVQVQMRDIHRRMAREHQCPQRPTRWCKQFGESSQRLTSVANGLFSEQRYQLEKPTTVADFNASEGCFLILTLAGESRYHSPSLKRACTFSMGKVTLGFAAKNEHYTIALQQPQIQQYSFSFSKPVLHAYLQEFDDAELLRALERAEETTIFNQIAISPTQRALLEKWSNTPFCGALQTIHQEMCAHELLISLLQSLSAQRAARPALRDSDRDRLQQAHAILLHDIQNPPTIKALAQMCALNTDKLIKGFKAVHGDSIHKTLVHARMQRAFVLQQQGEKSVQQVAFESGYDNVSYFIRVFKREFGKTPGQLLKERRFFI